MTKKKLLEEAIDGPAPEVKQAVKDGKEGYIFVSRPAYGEEDRDVTMSVPVADFSGQPTGHVTVTAQYTKNLGNYESAKIGIEVSLPVLASDEELVRVYDKAQTIVSEILQEQIAAVSK